jgi:predicted ribosome-associated RNA-binding protein Tma20
MDPLEHGVVPVNAGCREVVVSRKAGEAVLRGAPVFIPGVLAASPHIAAGKS